MLKNVYIDKLDDIEYNNICHNTIKIKSIDVMSSHILILV